MKKYINYVFSGSGAMFSGQLGAYKACEEIYNPKAFCGTSGGAIISVFLAQGLSSNRVLAKILDINFSTYIDNPYLDILNILDGKDLGLMKGEKVHQLLRKLIPEKFSELQYPLTIVATDINKRKGFIFSNVNTPDSFVADAVRASISLPGIFCPLKYENMLLIDGGLSENFYLNCFKDSIDNIIGIKINETHDFDEIKNIKSLLLQSLYTAIIQNENKNIKDENKALVIKLTVECDVFNFNQINKTKIQSLFDSGYVQAKQILIKNMEENMNENK